MSPWSPTPGSPPSPGTTWRGGNEPFSDSGWLAGTNAVGYDVGAGYDAWIGLDVEAAMKGTREVAWPVTTSTATTVAAFSPMLFWRGIMGDFMKYLPITVIITLSSSLFVAMIISPVVASIFSGGANHKPTDVSILLRAYWQGPAYSN